MKQEKFDHYLHTEILRRALIICLIPNILNQKLNILYQNTILYYLPITNSNSFVDGGHEQWSLTSPLPVLWITIFLVFVLQ